MKNKEEILSVKLKLCNKNNKIYFLIIDDIV